MIIIYFIIFIIQFKDSINGKNKGNFIKIIY